MCLFVCTELAEKGPDHFRQPDPVQPRRVDDGQPPPARFDHRPKHMAAPDSDIDAPETPTTSGAGQKAGVIVGSLLCVVAVVALVGVTITYKARRGKKQPVLLLPMENVLTPPAAEQEGEAYDQGTSA